MNYGKIALDPEDAKKQLTITNNNVGQITEQINIQNELLRYLFENIWELQNKLEPVMLPLCETVEDGNTKEEIVEVANKIRDNNIVIQKIDYRIKQMLNNISI